MIESCTPRTGRALGESDEVINVANIAKGSAGGYGANFLSDTVAHTPATGYVFIAVQVIADAVIAAYAPAYGGNTFTGVTLPAGTVIYGRFTSLTLASGKVLAYQGV